MADHRAQLIALFGGTVTAGRRAGQGRRRQPGSRSRRPTSWCCRRSSARRAEREAARWLLWEIGQAVGVAAILHRTDLLRAGAGRVRRVHGPAINVRMMAYDTARAIFRAAKAREAGAILLEIARSEIAYTDQRPAEYVSVMIGGGAARRATSSRSSSRAITARSTPRSTRPIPRPEVDEVKKLIAEEIGAGFYNIDVDTSTLVDLSRPTLLEQQRLNFEHAAEITALHPGARAGGDLGLGRRRDRRGGPQEQHGGGAPRVHGGLHRRAASGTADLEGISKISVQTGTSHGGVVLPDGSIAQGQARPRRAGGALQGGARGVRDVRGGAARRQHAAAGCVRHISPGWRRRRSTWRPTSRAWSSTIRRCRPSSAQRMYDWLDGNAQSERKDGDTPEQFYYKARKKAIGPFKREVWSLPPRRPGRRSRPSWRRPSGFCSISSR